jgi:peptidoglycan/LPS O-acetylase OafA/YrhL
MGIIRLLLALSVVFAHSTPFFGYSFVGGEIAVKAFYIISGFYMSLILNEKYIGKNGSYKLFITNRFIRLYPVYWIVLLMTIVFSVFCNFYTNGANPVKLKSYLEYGHSINIGSYIFLIFTNISMFFQDAMMFMGIDPSTGGLYFTENFRNSVPTLYSFLFVHQAWTISIELTFYLLAPVILRKKLRLVLLIIALSALLKIILWNSGFDYDPWTYRFFPQEIMFFMFGNIAYRIFIRLRNKVPDIKWLIPALAGIVYFTVVYYNFEFNAKNYLYFVSFTLLLPLIFLLTKNWKIDSYIGDLSYPIYIGHVFILYVLRFACKNEIQGWMLAIFSILFAIFLNEVIAKRIEKIRQRRLT